MTFTFPTDTNNKAGAVRKNQGGTGFHVPNVIYGADGITPISHITLNGGINALGIKEYNKFGDDSFLVKEVLVVGQNERKIVLDTDRSTVIDVLEFSSNGINTFIEIRDKKSDETYSLVNNDGSGTTNLMPSSIAKTGSGIYDVLVYDEYLETFKFRFRNKIHFQNGVVLTARNFHNDNKNLSVVASGREFD